MSTKKSLKPTKKVTAALIAGVALVLVGSALTLISPTTFAALGQWGPTVYAGVVLFGALLTGWLKKEQSTTPAAVKLDADAQTVASEVTPLVGEALENAPGIQASVIADAPKIASDILGVVGDVKSAE